MARPYPAGGVSIAESNHHAVGPLLLPLAAPSISAGLPSPVFPAPSLLLPTAITPDLGQGEEVRRCSLCRQWADSVFCARLFT